MPHARCSSTRLQAIRDLRARLVWAALMPMAALGALAADETTIANPTQRPHVDEVVRLLIPAPEAAVAVREDGAPIPFQVEECDGTRWIWVCSTFAPGQSHRYGIAPGMAERSRPRVQLTRMGDDYVLDNGLIAVRVPAAGAGAPGPISGVRLPDGSWIGGSAWSTSATPTGFTATVVGDGTILAKVRLKYRFAGPHGSDVDSATFADVEVALAPGWSHAEISERHEMSRDDSWNLDLAKGWAPRLGISRPFGGGAGENVKVPAHERELKPGALPFCREDLFIDLLPRWNQHYKDGWFFAASDGTNAAGAVAVKAGAWMWPHQNAIEALVATGGDTATLRLPTWKGARVWWLMAGAKAVGGDRPVRARCRLSLRRHPGLAHPPAGKTPCLGGSRCAAAGQRRAMTAAAPIQSYGDDRSITAPERR
jgi:hypothetical protein